MEQKIYQLVNKENDVRVECTEQFLAKWIERGFEIESTRIGQLLGEGE
ncbi:hypothetical protein [Paenibacillus silvae]|nr:hypothetical protein [Paenibacillus silvae]